MGSGLLKQSSAVFRNCSQAVLCSAVFRGACELWPDFRVGLFVAVAYPVMREVLVLCVTSGYARRE